MRQLTNPAQLNPSLLCINANKVKNTPAPLQQSDSPKKFQYDFLVPRILCEFTNRSQPTPNSTKEKVVFHERHLGIRLYAKVPIIFLSKISKRCLKSILNQFYRSCSLLVKFWIWIQLSSISELFTSLYCSVIKM